jgi:flagellin
MRVLSIQASNDTLTTSDRALIQTEVDQLLSEIDRMATGVTFNEIGLLNGVSVGGSAQGSIAIHAGASMDQTLTLDSLSSSVTTANLSINTLADGQSHALTSTSGAESAIQLLTNAINTISSTRANIGAMQNRLEHTYNFVGISMENQMAAESRIRDVDFASEMINYTKQQILAQAGNSMLAQANLRPQSVLQLLG